MAGGGSRYRHLSRDSAHRQAMLRNLVTSLFKHETITTTWPKAKEAQRLAEKLITLGKKNTEASRRRALEIFYVCRFPEEQAHPNYSSQDEDQPSHDKSWVHQIRDELLQFSIYHSPGKKNQQPNYNTNIP